MSLFAGGLIIYAVIQLPILAQAVVVVNIATAVIDLM